MPDDEATLNLEDDLPTVSAAIPLPPLLHPTTAPLPLPPLNLTLAYATPGVDGPSTDLFRRGGVVVKFNGSRFPDRCVKCNVLTVPSERWRKARTWHHPAIYFVLFAGLLPYVIVALCVRKGIVIDAGICRACRGRLRRRLWCAWGFVLLGMVLSTLAFAYFGDGRHDQLVAIILITSIVVIIGSLIFVTVAGPALKVKFIREDSAGFVGAGERFLDSLPAWH